MSELKAVSRELFANKSWKHPGHQRIAAQSHLIPVVAAELDKLVPALPLAFVQDGERWQLVAVTALQPGTNLFIGPDGRWNGGYVPASVRAYPFKLVTPEGGKDAVLCVREDSDWIMAAGQGNPFFAEDGQPASVTREMLDFLSEIERSRVATQRAVDALAAAGVLAPWNIQVQLDAGVRKVEGLSRVNEAVLNALPPDAFAALRETGALALAYGQIFSAGRLDQLPVAAALQARQLAAQAPDPAGSLNGLGLGMAGDTLKFN